MEIKTQTFSTPEGEIKWFTLTNKNGNEVVLSNLGAAIVAVRLKKADGSFDDVVIGYDDPAAYFGDGPCAGKTPGRYANRIARGRFTLDGKTYELPVNNGPNHLHGGPDGFQNRIWKGVPEGSDKVIFTLESPDGDAGYPGNLTAKAVYTWSDDNTLEIDLSATSDADTIVNLTNHSYFNLDGHASGSGLGQTLTLRCSKWLPTDDTLIPTGEIADVKGTPMDFTTPHTLGERIREDFPALVYGKGYDNCWLVDENPGTLREAAVLKSADGSRTLTVLTTQPAVQVYTGNWLEGCPAGKDGAVYHDYAAIAIECQGCPDAPNHPAFPSQTLRAGEEYRELIQFRFS